MMKKRIALLLPILLGAVALLFATAKGAADDFVFTNLDYRADLSMPGAPVLVDVASRFVIQYANELKNYDVGPMDPVLLALIGQVADRPVIQYANELKTYDVGPMDPTLLALIGQVADRPVVQYANELKYYDVGPMDPTLLALIGQVADRPVIQYANEAKQITLGFPVGIVPDTTAPWVVNLIATRLGGGFVRLVVTTSEVCEITLEYGTSPGSYGTTVAGSSISGQHTIQMSGVQPGTQYYFRFQMTDRSGNSAYSGEYQLADQSSIFLPFVRK